MGAHLELMQNFTQDNLPDLDEVVLAALELFAQVAVPEVSVDFEKPLVVGSVNGAATGRILFSDREAVCTDESSYQEKLEAVSGIDGAVVLSASGAKHAITIAQELQRRSLPTVLFTNNPDAPARQFISPERVHVFPKNREPYTYNTSTYMGFILSKTKEDASAILSFIAQEVAPRMPDVTAYSAHCLIVPPHFNELRPMLSTKYDELFGPKLVGRVFTSEQMMHAKTVVRSDSELFISFGAENVHFGSPEHRLHIPLPEGADHAAMMAIGYYVIGCMQRQLPAYFKENIGRYVEEASEVFGSTIPVIVE